MLTRRHFIATGAATITGMAAAPAIAQRTYTMPQEHMPVIIRVSNDWAPGEVHVDPNTYHLYLMQEKGKAIRYVVGVAKDNLYEPGEFTVGRKVEWPTWKPTPSMIERNPSYASFEDGMPGGPTNPLGARALYLYNENGYDTALRIHGTPEPWTVMQSISNGCVRLINSHVAHLYERVPTGSRVVLHPKLPSA
ncbi:L,D-transpeptidase [Pseudoruegeria sp. HB172150]|uniref:L,D-transpeptidase n=1 Tax=Pseudoruegeria sp. HB172150 TaxID=2721164 RepID=UPI001556A9BA|nr:L,D-transpeptidase [Pseudoruegeria sp. HB172150]